MPISCAPVLPLAHRSACALERETRRLSRLSSVSGEIIAGSWGTSSGSARTVNVVCCLSKKNRYSLIHILAGASSVPPGVLTSALPVEWTAPVETSVSLTRLIIEAYPWKE
jgi:hypothetical protein